MIASLKGTVEANSGREVIIDVHGVGYLVQVTTGASLSLTLGSNAVLQIAHVIREDAQQLFGFETLEQRRLFDILRSVNGVGPKTALAILDANTPAQIAIAVANEDDGPFAAVSGIGPKTAKLIVVSLSGKLSSIVVDTGVRERSTSPKADVVAALVGLGWPANSSSEAVEEILAVSENGIDVSNLLKLAISKLGAK